MRRDGVLVHECIIRNLPGSTGWEGSFYERLSEAAVWDRDGFWELHLALVEAASGVGSDLWISRELAWAVAKLHSDVLRLIAAHFDPNDAYKISNVTPDELYEFLERFEHASLAVFSGDVMPEASYDLTNPLIREV